MRKTIILMLVCFTLSLTAQVARDNIGNFYELPHDSMTIYTYTDINNKVYPVYLSKTGKYYILRKSKKTGNYYKQYLKLKENETQE